MGLYPILGRSIDRLSALLEGCGEAADVPSEVTEEGPSGASSSAACVPSAAAVEEGPSGASSSAACVPSAAGVVEAARAPAAHYVYTLHAWDGEGTSGESGGHLTFPEGVYIEVLQAYEPGKWWQGALEGRSGWYPSSFTTVVEAAKPVDETVAGAPVGDPAADISTADASATHVARPPLPRAFSAEVLDVGLRAYEAEQLSA